MCVCVVSSKETMNRTPYFLVSWNVLASWICIYSKPVAYQSHKQMRNFGWERGYNSLSLQHKACWLRRHSVQVAGHNHVDMYWISSGKGTIHILELKNRTYVFLTLLLECLIYRRGNWGKELRSNWLSRKWVLCQTQLYLLSNGVLS